MFKNRAYLNHPIRNINIHIYGKLGNRKMITFNEKACYYCKNDTWNQLEYKGICPDVDAKEKIPVRFCHLTPIVMIQCIVLFDD